MRNMPTSATIVHDGFEYRTLMPGVSADGIVPKCHRPGLWLPLPDEGWEIAPDTADIRHNVVAMHSWSSQVVVLSSLKGIITRIAYRPKPIGALFSRGFIPGSEFGDMQPKAKARYRNGVKEWTCPWTCYQILIRRRLQDEGGVAEHLLPLHRGKTIGDFLEANPGIVDRFGKKALKLIGRLGRPAHENDYKHPAKAMPLPLGPPDEEAEEEEEEEEERGGEEEEDEPVDLEFAEEDMRGLPSLPWMIAIGATCLSVATVCLSCGVCLGARWFSRGAEPPVQPLLQVSGRNLVPFPGAAAAATADTGLTSYQEMEI